MKLRLTEGQYKRLLSEDNKSRFNTITPQVVKLMELINKHHRLSPKEEITKFLIRDMGLTNNESLTIWNSWVKDFSLLDSIDYRNSIGNELEFKGVYELPTILPSYLCGRTYLPGFVTVEASSKEEAVELMMSGNYIDMEVDEETQEYHNPDLDYDSEDIDIQYLMVVDHLHDDNEEDLIDKIKLKP